MTIIMYLKPEFLKLTQNAHTHSNAMQNQLRSIMYMFMWC